MMSLDYAVRQQATVIAFDKIFLMMGISFVCALPLLFLFRTGRVRGGGRSSAAH